MVRLRLARAGTRNRPFYHVVACDQRKKRDGRFLENVGYYDPLKENLHLDGDRLTHWIQKGARPTDTVLRLLKTAKRAASAAAAPTS